MEVIAGKRLKLKHRRNEILWGWVFLAPMIAGFILFFLFPFVYAVIISLSTYDLFSPPKLMGFGNFVRAFSDTFFLRALLNALINALGVPAGILIALMLSSFLVNNKHFSLFYRTVFFLPTICGAVAITFIWQWMYAPTYGILYRVFDTLGLKALSEKLTGESFSFLSTSNFMVSMITMGVWSGLGISILMFFSSLKGAPKSLYEAAAIDGANAWQRFRHITFNVISPVTFYILITGISGSFQDFTRFEVMRGGAFNETSIMPVWWIYNHTGKFGYEYGYASALGFILGLIILIIAAVNFVASKYWVKYDS